MMMDQFLFKSCRLRWRNISFLSIKILLRQLKALLIILSTSKSHNHYRKVSMQKKFQLNLSIK